MVFVLDSLKGIQHDSTDQKPRNGDYRFDSCSFDHRAGGYWHNRNTLERVDLMAEHRSPSLAYYLKLRAMGYSIETALERAF